MMRLRVIAVLAALSFLALLSPARAELDLPGLAPASNSYAQSLARKFPTGGSDAARASASDKAAKALAARDWAAAITALESRLGMNQTTASMWQDLASAALHRTPPDAQKALLAGWQGWSHSDHGTAGIPALLLMADALELQKRPAQEIAVLRQAAELAPDDHIIAAQLETASKAAGMLIAKFDTEPDADRPRACITFTVPPSKRPDFMPGDWITAKPAVADLSVTREGEQICVSGLPSGRTTQLTLRSGLPATQNLTLHDAVTLDVAMANRAPNLGFDTRLFVLPRGQSPAITLSSVNLSGVSLKLVRLSERSVADLLRRGHLGDAIESWRADNLAEEVGSVVWTGKADIPGYAPNATTRTALPLPDALKSTAPGLYVLMASPGDGTQADATATQLIERTDLAPSIWRGSDGLTVQIRDYGNAGIRPGVTLRLLARNNDILAEAQTDADGVARFAAPLLRGEGPLAPAAIHAFATIEGGQDFAALDLNVAAFDLSDRGVEGQPHPGPIDSYLWPDRGIYRPGETVHIMALIRDAAGQPADLPAQLTIRRPNGQVFQQTVPPRTEGAAIHQPVALSPTAPTGMWTAELRADPDGPVIGSTSFRVDAFVPERMAVEITQPPEVIIPGQSTTLPVAARFLYGAPASELTGRATLHLFIDKQPFPPSQAVRSASRTSNSHRTPPKSTSPRPTPRATPACRSASPPPPTPPRR